MEHLREIDTLLFESADDIVDKLKTRGKLSEKDIATLGHIASIHTWLWQPVTQEHYEFHHRHIGEHGHHHGHHHHHGRHEHHEHHHGHHHGHHEGHEHHHQSTGESYLSGHNPAHA